MGAAGKADATGPRLQDCIAPLAQSTTCCRTPAACRASSAAAGSASAGAWARAVRSVARNLLRSVASNWL